MWEESLPKHTCGPPSREGSLRAGNTHSLRPPPTSHLCPCLEEARRRAGFWLPPRPSPPGPLGAPAGKKLPRTSGVRQPDPVPCLSSEEPPLDLTGKVYQLEAMLKQLHTDLQKVSSLLLHFPEAQGTSKVEAPVLLSLLFWGKPPSFECSHE